MWIKKISVHPVKHDDQDYCGPAVAWTILDALASDPAAPSQGQLMDYMNIWSPGSTFKTTPLGMACGLNGFAPSWSAAFQHDCYSLPNAASREIVSAIHGSGVPVAALIFSIDHWVVVFGVQTDVEPVSGAAYSIDALWFVDSMIGAFEQVVYSEWIATFFTGCFVQNVAPQPFVIVADERRTHGAVHRTTGFVPRSFADRPGPNPAQGPFREKVIAAAKSGLNVHGLGDVVAEGTVTDVPFVTPRPGSRADGYYLVVFSLPSDQWVCARISFRGQNYLGAQFAKPAAVEGRVQLERALLDGSNPLSVPFSEMGFQQFNTAGATLDRDDDNEPVLVWEASRESSSPYLPFFRMSSHGETIYVRSDLKVATRRLHTYRDPVDGTVQASAWDGGQRAR